MSRSAPPKTPMRAKRSGPIDPPWTSETAAPERAGALAEEVPDPEADAPATDPEGTNPEAAPDEEAPAVGALDEVREREEMDASAVGL